VPEYAREYLLKNGTGYNFDDLLTIAKGQIALEEKYVRLVTDAILHTPEPQPCFWTPICTS